MKQLYYFSADWCMPCKALGPTMNRISEQIPVSKINIDNETTLTMEYGIRNIPTVVLVEDGKEIRRFSGNKSYNDVMDFCNG